MEPIVLAIEETPITYPARRCCAPGCGDKIKGYGDETALAVSWSDGSVDFLEHCCRRRFLAGNAAAMLIFGLLLVGCGVPGGSRPFGRISDAAGGAAASVGMPGGAGGESVAGGAGVGGLDISVGGGGAAPVDAGAPESDSDAPEAGPSLDCLEAPAGSCTPAQAPYGWVCWPAPDPPHPGCELAAEQVPQAGASTWCCDEPCAPYPYQDPDCAASYPGLPRYFRCYSGAASLPGCALFGPAAVCCP